MRGLRLAGWLVAACAATLALAASSGARVSITPGLLGTPPPASAMITTRLGALSLSSHIVRAGGTLTGTVPGGCIVAPGIAGAANQRPCPITWTGFTIFGKRVSGCGSHDLKCTVKVPASATSTGYSLLTVGITNIQGTGVSNNYVAIVGRGDAVIEGTVLNKEHQPVAGATIDLYGPKSATAATGADGFYAADVTAGSYRVVPSGAGLAKTAPSFSPTDARVSVRAGGTGKADFIAQITEVVRISLSAGTVPADGLHIVTGTITVTLNGTPMSGAAVDLWPKDKSTPEDAVTKGSLATVCGPNGRVWPQGTLPDPNGGAVQVTMDSTGKYQFSLDAGTVPGAFTVTAWALEITGALITDDLADATDTATLNLTPVLPSGQSGFVGELAALKSTPQLKGITNDAGQDTAAFAQLAASKLLGGLAFSWINGTNGTTAVLIYAADQPPTFNPKTGSMLSHGGLVLQPSEWVSSPTVADVQTAIQTGQLKDVPTFAQWIAGAKGVANWNLVPNTATPWSQNFLFNGWPYQSTAPGSCS